jgi:hypothetical protein
MLNETTNTEVETEASTVAIATLEAAVETAKAAWTGLDWETDLTCGNCDDDYEGDPEGLEEAKAAERQDVEDDASGAASLGAEAVALARKGNWRGCVLALEEAARLESGYGDSPAWGPALEVACRLRDEDTNTSSTVKIKYGSNTIVMSWDGAQASAPILVNGEPTQYQTADARHRTQLAVALACLVAWPDVEWPAVPSVGSIDLGHWAEDNEAWDDVSYETV